MDKPAAALIKDLKVRGLLDDTIVIWTRNFGGCPAARAAKDATITHSLSRAGSRRRVQRRSSYGESDEMVLQGRQHFSDVLLRLTRDDSAPARINHEKLTFRHNGIDRRLTDVHGDVIKEIVAG